MQPRKEGLVVESPIIVLVDHFQLSIRKQVEQGLRVGMLHVICSMLQHFHLIFAEIYAIPERITKLNIID